MPDYKNRSAELLKAIDALQPKLPEEAAKKLREAVDAYAPLRKTCLDELLALLTDDSSSNTSNAARFKSRCETMQGAVAAPFDNALNGIKGEAEAACRAWVSTVKVDENGFFKGLADPNAAAARDYLVTNRLNLATYTETLEKKWESTVRNQDGLHAAEQKEYEQMAAMVRKVLEDLVSLEKAIERYASKGRDLLLDIAKSPAGSKILSALAKFVDDNFGGSSEGISNAAKYYDLRKQLSLDPLARKALYDALLQAESGGVLPLFAETRREVSEYWEKYGFKSAELELQRATDVLEKWRSACSSDGQKADCKEFSDAALAALRAHKDRVNEVAGKFETRWNGVFKGPLRSDVLEQLIEAKNGPIRARILVDIGTPRVVRESLERMNGYYLVSFEDSFIKLREYVKTLPKEEQADALKAVESCEKRAQEAVRDKLKAMLSNNDETLDWFKPGNLDKIFDRESLKKPLI